MGAKLGRGKPNRPIIVKGAPSVVPARVGAQPIVISTSSARYRAPNCRRISVAPVIVAVIDTTIGGGAGQPGVRVGRSIPNRPIIVRNRLDPDAPIPAPAGGFRQYREYLEDPTVELTDDEEAIAAAVLLLL